MGLLHNPDLSLLNYYSVGATFSLLAQFAIKRQADFELIIPWTTHKAATRIGRKPICCFCTTDQTAARGKLFIKSESASSVLNQNNVRWQIFRSD